MNNHDFNKRVEEIKRRLPPPYLRSSSNSDPLIPLLFGVFFFTCLYFLVTAGSQSVYIFETERECSNIFSNEKWCKDQLHIATELHKSTVVDFNSLDECDAIYGENYCEETVAHTYSPLMKAFIIKHSKRTESAHQLVGTFIF